MFGPVFDKMLGVWEGTYTLLDIKGSLLDHHRSRLEIYRDGDKLCSRNIYTWEDGRSLMLPFSSMRINEEGNQFYVQSDRLDGVMQEVGNDIIILVWTYKDQPQTRMCEIIRLISDQHRARTWQYIENDHLTRVMMIEEYKVADSVTP